MSETFSRDESMNVQDAIRQAQHGDVIKDDNGIAGIVIDDDVVHEQNKPEKVKLIEKYISDQKAEIDFREKKLKLMVSVHQLILKKRILSVLKMYQMMVEQLP